METKNQSQSNQRKIIILLAALIALLIVVLAVVLMRGGSQDIPDGPVIGYETEASVMLDQAALQDAVDEALANAQDNMVALEYKNDAYSTDGKKFSCYIVNSASNLYDMFLTIYSDAEMTDQVYLSGLVPPGSGFEEITLDHELQEGDHTVYIAITQVDTSEDGGQVIKNQVVHTMVFHVAKS